MIEQTDFSARAKWGDAIDAGFVQIPNELVFGLSSLKLTPTDFAVLANLLAHWWGADDRPFPRNSVIADRTGLTVRTVQRSLARLQKRGLIHKGRDAARRRWDYGFSGLVREVQKLASSTPRAQIAKRRERPVGRPSEAAS